MFDIRCSECQQIIDQHETFEQYGGRVICKACKCAARKSTASIVDVGTAVYLLKKVRGLKSAAVGIRSALETYGLMGSEEEMVLLAKEVLDVGEYLRLLGEDIEESSR